MTTTESKISAPFALGRDLVWPVRFAGKLACDRRSKTIDVCDLWSGIYIADFERITAYFTDWRKLEEVLCDECQLDMPRWFYWCSLYDELSNPQSPHNKFWPYSLEMAEIFREAGTLAQRRDPEKHIPEVHIEDILVALLARVDNGVCRKVAAVGLVKERFHQ